MSRTEINKTVRTRPSGQNASMLSRISPQYSILILYLIIDLWDKFIKPGFHTLLLIYFTSFTATANVLV
jgi:hypothetical protein